MAEKKGLTHFYYGYGKGKTTAAMGLAVRASGCGRKVVVVQFLKNINSAEVAQLEKLGIKVLRGQATNAFSLNMTEEELAETKRIHEKNFSEAKEIIAKGECDMLVLDEVIDAYQLDLIDKPAFEAFVQNKPENLELVITGHKREEWLVEYADYVTEALKIKHPFDKGIKARKGIEY